MEWIDCHQFQFHLDNISQSLWAGRNFGFGSVLDYLQ